MEDLVRIVGENIRFIRKSKELNQEELAYQAGLHPTYIGKVERGEKNLTLESLIKITKSLDISLEEFFSLVDPKLDAGNNVLMQLIDLLKSRNSIEQKKLLEIMRIFVDMVDG